jgi:hypothetical protein
MKKLMIYLLGVACSVALSASVAYSNDGVGIYIKPGGLNNINPFSRGVIPVAILGSEAFDVENVDAFSLVFGPAEASPAHKAFGHLEDVNEDGFTDLVSHYRTLDTGIAPGDVEACVRGQTFDGVPFELCDEINTVGPN